MRRGTRGSAHSSRGARTLFVKKATQDMLLAKKEWNDRRRILLYIRNELRFYAEFAEALQSRGVDLPLSHHLAGVNLDGLEAHDEPEVDFCGGVMLLQALEPSRYFQTSPLRSRAVCEPAWRSSLPGTSSVGPSNGRGSPSASVSSVHDIAGGGGGGGVVPSVDA